jgi:hypothetical protein
MYGAGFSGEWMMDDLYGYCSTFSSDQSSILSYTFFGEKTNDPLSGSTLGTTPAITLAGQKMHKLSPRVQMEGLRIRMQATATGSFQQEFIVLGSQSFGLEDSGLS